MIRLNVTTAGALDFDTVSAGDACRSEVLSAFGAVSGIQTNNGNITVQSFGHMVISNPLAAGTGNVSLTTTTGSGGNINDSGGSER